MGDHEAAAVKTPETYKREMYVPMIGKSLVHYGISTQTGRGGTGEGYQAKDTKRGRGLPTCLHMEKESLPHEPAHSAPKN